MTSFEGDTGPYLQYAHARLCSISRKASVPAEDLDCADLSLLTESHAVNLVRALSSWPDVVQNTLKTLEPVTVLAYLFKMTHMLSSSYDVLKVVGSEPELKKARMALYEAARQVLNNGMKLLGLNPVERLESRRSSSSCSRDTSSINVSQDVIEMNHSLTGRWLVTIYSVMKLTAIIVDLTSTSLISIASWIQGGDY